MYFLNEYLRRVNEQRDCPALTDRDGKRHITYGQLDSLSNRIANKLISKGAKRGDCIVIVLPRISEYIACEIAILKIGAVIIPLVPEYPDDRVDYIMKDTNAALIIKEDFLESIEDEPGDLELADAGDDERGMIIFTSGSTGRPKGVVYTRTNIDAQVIRKIQNVEGIVPLVFAATATMSFCVSMTEYFRALAIGGHLHIVSDEVRSDADKLSGYYNENRITAGYISPRLLRRFSCKNEYLKRVFTAGEKVVNTYSADFDIINCYGQSETAGTIIEFKIDRLYDNTPIGKPLGDTEAIVIDSDGNEVPDGQEGQICMIGNLPQEYNNLPEQTARVFKKLPDGRSLIYSGDIGKKLPDGNLLYLNRNDWMIKIHGQRVEPGEIEAVMYTVPGITACVVKAFENADGTMFLCGFYTEDRPVDKSDIKKYLAAKLPDYMIPGVFVKRDSFPYNTNGKTDRKALEKPDFNKLLAEYEKPENRVEEIICDSMSKVLRLVRVGRNDNFIELGGNSLDAVSLCAECNVEGLAPQIVMLGQTPANMAKLLQEKKFYPKPEISISEVVKMEYPLSMSQRYQYEMCRGYGVTIDVIDRIYFFKPGAAVDLERLRTAIETVVGRHPIYTCHIDVDNNLLMTDEHGFTVSDTCLSAQEFKDYRYKLYRRVRDLKTDPLFEASFIHLDDGSTYLYMCLCHMIYDGKSLSNFLRSVSAVYAGNEADAEQASIFDLINYEGRLRDDTELNRNAVKLLEADYEGLNSLKLFGDEKKYSTKTTRSILKKMGQDEIDGFLKKNGISILTLLQMAFEMAVSQIFKADDFCYMNVYDGRNNQLLNDSHGVFARPVFMRSGVGRYKDTGDYFRAIEGQYQNLVYYDVRDTFDNVKQFPAVKTGLTLNFRDVQGFALKLGDEILFPEFDTEFDEVNKAFTDFDFIINRLPGNRGYIVTLASAKVSDEFAGKFIDCFEDKVGYILEGESRTAQ